MTFKRSIYTAWILFLIPFVGFTQQDPEYTQYMYNTMTINPGYAASKDYTSLVALARTQWVGISGAPRTQTFSFQTSLGKSGLGLGMNIMNDEIGPSEELFFDTNIAYAIRTGEKGQLALGLRAGARMLNIDWSKGRFQQADVTFNENISNRFLPTLGMGVYYFEDRWYAGFSVPNFLKTEHYDDLEESVAAESLHYFLIGGYVFGLTPSIKFKPATLVKIVPGSPVSLDVSANFLYANRFTLGVAYRWEDSISALAGVQVLENLNIGYAYDLTTSDFRNYNSGTHEVFLQYDIFKQTKLKSPRFF